MKIIFVDANATTPQYYYPLLEELIQQQVDITLFSSVNIYNSDYYIRNYAIRAEYFFFRIANKIKNQKLRRIIKLLCYPFDSLRFLRKIKKQKPQIVHYNWLAVPLIDQLVIKKLKSWQIKIFITRHDFIPHEFSSLQPGDWNCLRLADKIICLSDAIRSRFPQDFQSRISVIRHGNTYEKEMRMFAGLGGAAEPEKLTVLLIGNLKPYKGIMILLQAVNELIREGSLPELKLKLTGKCEKNLRKEIDGFIREMALEKYVETNYNFISYEEMFREVSYCSVGILPYLWGSQSGLPYIFYAFQKPLILSNICGISEQGNSRISITIKPDKEEIKKALLHFNKNRHTFRAQDFQEFLAANSCASIAGEIKENYFL